MNDLRLVPLAITIWLAAIVVPVLPPWVVIAAVSIPAALALTAFLALYAGRQATPRRRWFLPCLLVVLGAAAGSAVSALHVVSVRSGPLPALAAESAFASVDLEIKGDPRRRVGRGPGRPPYVVIDAEAVLVTSRGRSTAVRNPVLVTAGTEWAELQAGQRIRARGRLASTDPGDRVVAIVSARGPPQVRAEPGSLERTANRLRAGLRDAASRLPSAERALLPSLIVGDTSALSAELEADLRTSGLAHLTAVSGTNLTLLLAFVLGAGRALGLRRPLIPAVGLATVAMFVVVCRAEPSVVRAAAMGLVGLAGLSAGHRRRGLAALAVAVIALLLLDPWLGRSFGFALSVSATAGILVLGDRFTTAISGPSGRVPRWLAAGVAIPLAAQVACTPLVVLISGELSIIAVVANLLAGPAVGPATVLGMFALCLAPLSTMVAAVPAWTAYPFVWWIVRVATHGSDAPGASVSWPVTPIGIVVLIALCLLLALIGARVLRRRAMILGLVAVLVVWLVQPFGPPVAPPWVTAWPPRGWRVIACDIGQGDGLLLRVGRRTDAAVVVDTGPDSERMDRCLREAGIRTVPYVLLTHFHADHTGGLAGVVAGREVGEIGIRPLAGRAEPRPDSRFEAPAGSEDHHVREIARDSAGTRVRPVVVGQRRRIDGLTLTILGPAAGRSPSDRDGEEGAKENDASVVVMAELDGLRILLTGDVEPPGQRALLRSGVDLRAAVFKVPHHGSRFQDPEFLARVRPSLAIVTAGADNDYGHPAVSTVRALRRQGVEIARTDADGAIAVVRSATPQGSGLFVVRRGMLARDG